MLAAPYSGATLFAIILDRDPGLCCDGETFSLRPGQMCSCGEAQEDCDYYSSVASHMKLPDGSGWDHDLFRHVPRYSRIPGLDRALSAFCPSPGINAVRHAILSLPGFRQRTDRFLAAHKMFVEKCIEERGVSVYVDGGKIPRRVELLAESGSFDLSVIHLIRDGRGFCNSFRKNTNEPDLRKAAYRWNAEIAKVDEFSRRFADIPIHRVRYEDLCHDLVGVMKGVRKFLGVQSSSDYVFDLSQPFHVIGNRMRNDFNGVIREDLKWKQAIGPADLKGIEAIMEEGLRRFDYPVQ